MKQIHHLELESMVDWNEIRQDAALTLAASQAISLKRIADALELLAQPEISGKPVEDIVVYVDPHGKQI